MKKLFISCPMKGRTEEEIRRSFEKLHKIAEVVYEEELAVIPSFIPEAGDNPIEALGDSIRMLGMADLFIGISWKAAESWNGCYIENTVAKRYGIPMYQVPMKVACPEKG